MRQFPPLLLALGMFVTPAPEARSGGLPEYFAGQVLELRAIDPYPVEDGECVFCFELLEFGLDQHIMIAHSHNLLTGATPFTAEARQRFLGRMRFDTTPRIRHIEILATENAVPCSSACWISASVQGLHGSMRIVLNEEGGIDSVFWLGDGKQGGACLLPADPEGSGPDYADYTFCSRPSATLNCQLPAAPPVVDPYGTQIYTWMFYRKLCLKWYCVIYHLPSGEFVEVCHLQDASCA